MMSSGPSFNEGSRADASLILDNDNVDVLAITKTPVEDQAAQALVLELKLRSDQVDVNADSRTEAVTKVSWRSCCSTARETS
jgi:hypothetical protein